MLRHAFTMKLRPGAYAEYRHLHLNEAGEPDLGELNEMFTLGRAARGESAEAGS